MWRAVRALVLAGTGGLLLALAVRPALGLALLWAVAVPLLPLVFLAAPGLWRNLCPMAALGQAPRVLGLTRGRPMPRWLREHGYAVAVGLFVAALVARTQGLDRSALASGALVAGALVAAVAGGLAFRGKVGWCASVCPLRPVEEVYGHAPLVRVERGHCRPCVGCVGRCPDLRPDAVHGAALHRLRPGGRPLRFAAALPGLVVGLHLAPSGAWAIPVLAAGAAAALAGAGALRRAMRLGVRRELALSAAASFALFYWWNAPAVVEAVAGLGGWPPPAAAAWLARAGALMLALGWLARAWRGAARAPSTPVRARPVLRPGASAPLRGEPARAVAR
jgi:hypothetical protein